MIHSSVNYEIAEFADCIYMTFWDVQLYHYRLLKLLQHELENCCLKPLRNLIFYFFLSIQSCLKALAMQILQQNWLVYTTLALKHG